MFLRIIGLLLLTVVAACSSVQSQVTAFHKIDQNTSRQFSVTPAPSFAGSLEASTYATHIARKLSERGWTQSRNPDIEVVFGYAIDEGRTHISSVPIYGQTGGGSSQTYGTITGPGGMATVSGTTYSTPTYGVVGVAPVSQTIYTRVFVLEMYDKASKSKIYESRVVSSGENSTFSQVSKCMIAALFQDFPGVSGKTSTITLDLKSCEKD